MFSKKFLLDVDDVDPFLELKVSSLFVMMQNVAIEAAEQTGIGKTNTIDKGLFWVITRHAITIHKMPKYLETITVSTYPGNDLKFIFPRYFEVRNEAGELLITSSSTWAVLSKETRKIVLDPFDGHSLPPEHYDWEEPLPKKITAESLSFIEERRVRFSDCDLNVHLNNTKYIEYITDIHDYEFYKKHRVQKLVINYDKEITSTDTVKLYSNNQNPELISGKVNDFDCFNVEIIYVER